MLSVIIISYNTRELTAKAVRSVQTGTAGMQTEIIVLDNGSIDNSVEYLRRRFPEIRIIESDWNLGFARAVNRAAAEATGDFLWLVNSDCSVKENTASLLFEYINKNPDVAVVTGRLLNPDGSFQGSCRHFPNYLNIMFSRGSPLSRLISREGAYTLPDFSEPTEVDSCAFTNAMIRKAHFEEIRGLDERFFIYLEDTDICRRLGELGYGIVYHPQAESTHLWGVSFHSNLIQRYFHHHISVGKYFWKHYTQNKLKNALFELGLGLWLGLRCAFAVMRGRI